VRAPAFGRSRCLVPAFERTSGLRSAPAQHIPPWKPSSPTWWTYFATTSRGNQDSRWLASGGYEHIARTVFRHIRAQRLLLEYDDARSGSFEPLKEVPEDKLVVLGLITTKRPRHEPMDELERRIREASRFVPLERLAVSPQCGFSSSVIGNAITAADQERKLSLVVDTARRVWGEDAPLRSSS
jgi:methionine synthase II (cobalamin-independent)